MFAALLPIFLVILLGWALRRGGMPGDAFWPLVDRLTYFLFFPCLLLLRLAEAEFAGLPVAAMAVAIVSGALLSAALLLATGPRLSADIPAFTSLFQGGIRPNTYVGLAAVAALYGDPGLALLAVAIAVLVPLVNLLSVAVLTHWLARGRRSPVQLLIGVARNPIILACLLGIGLNLSGLHLPEGLRDGLAIVGQAALPLGLLAVGAGLDPQALRTGTRALLLASAVKLLLFPLLTLGIGRLLGIDGPALAVAVLFSAVPASVSSYALASQLGGDTRLMAAIITGQTLLAVLTLPLMLQLAG